MICVRRLYLVIGLLLLAGGALAGGSVIVDRDYRSWWVAPGMIIAGAIMVWAAPRLKCDDYCSF